METGTVIAVIADKGYGFIKPNGGGKDLFFHAKQVADGLAFDEQLLERRVMFEIDDLGRGPRAVNVQAE